MKFGPVLMILAAGLFSFRASAGWNSGGGELVKDANNPWFIQNTKEVKYCVLIDKDNFQLSEILVGQAIQNALAYWKEEFARATSLAVGDVRILIATQKFLKTSCDANPDVVFQMGYLSGEQIKRIGDPTHYISLAVRTDYEPQTLRGKGFVYISPDSGPLKPADSRLIEKPWSIGTNGLLVKVLIHELGHLFGLQHSASYIFPVFLMAGVMSATFPEFILNKEYAAAIEKLPTEAYFSVDKNKVMNVLDFCRNPDLGTLLTSFFGIPHTWNCLNIKYKEGVLSVYASKDDRDHMDLIGTAVLDEKENSNIESPIQFWLNADQKVFQAHDQLDKYVWGPFVNRSEKKGTYRSLNGNIERKIFATFPLNFPSGRVGGIMEGELYMDLTYGN